MSTSLATLLFVGFILWLFSRDAKQHPTVSSAIWIPLTWAFIITSKPISVWMGITPEGAEEDSPVDKVLFLALIGAGMFILKKRRADWRALLRRNKWLFVYFAYQGLSVTWSDESFTAFKRWIKDFGNVIMVLVILAEKDPVESVKAFLTRYASLVIPMSVLYVKYYPESRRYDMWTSQPVFVGMTTDKNTFGMGLFVCGLALVWLLTQRRKPGERRMDKTSKFTWVMLIAMMIWLLMKAHSATAISMTMFGAMILLGVRIEAVRKQVRRIGTYVISLGVAFVLLQATGLWQTVLGTFAETMGRDPSLHGRSDIWAACLKEDINPAIGTGFYSFWSPERNKRVSEGWYYNLGTAHNGYIETYLNTGLIGVFLLVTMIGSSLNGIKRDVIGGSPFGALRLAFLFTIVLYCASESAFDRLVPVWFTLLLVVAEYPHAPKKKLDAEKKSSPVAANQPDVNTGSIASPRWSPA